MLYEKDIDNENVKQVNDEAYGEFVIKTYERHGEFFFIIFPRSKGPKTVNSLDEVNRSFALISSNFQKGEEALRQAKREIDRIADHLEEA